MDDAETRQLYRLNIAKWDMDKAVEFLAAAATHKPPSTEFEALVISGIIHYARPFSMNEKEKGAMADSRVPTEVVADLTPDERKLHDLLVSRRNKAIAHSEWTHFPVGVDKESRVISSRRYSVYPEFMNVLPALDLARKLLKRLHFLVADRLLERP